MDIDQIIKGVEDAGCNCDLGVGWVCGIHEKIQKLKEALLVLPVNLLLPDEVPVVGEYIKRFIASRPK